MEHRPVAGASRVSLAFSLLILVPALALGPTVGCGSEPLAPIPDTDSDGGGGTQNDGGGGVGSDGGGTAHDASTGSDGGDAGPQCTPFAGGAPVTGPAGKWTWVDVPDMKCRDKSSTGIGVRLKPGSKKLFIYLQGGGACFNAATCALNPTSFSAATFNDTWVGTQGSAGIMNDGNAANPVKDWNAVFVPFCSGDIFGGSAPDANVPGGGPQHQMFTGVASIAAMLKRVVPTFPDVDQVLLTGSSAGGFGSAVSYERVAKAFCPRPVMLIDDAGPIMSDDYLAPCLQARLRSVWNFDQALPVGCPGCDDPQTHGGIVNALPYLIRQYPQARFGLVSALQDEVIRTFMSFGENKCASIDGFPPGYDGTKFQNGLANLRDMYLKPTNLASTYYVSGTQHTFLADNGFFSTTVHNVPLPTWVAGIIEGKAPVQVAP